MLFLIPILLLTQEISIKPTVQGDPQPLVAVKPADPALELIGKKAPDFTLPDQLDRPVALKDAKKAKKWVVLAFYPADMTGG